MWLTPCVQPISWANSSESSFSALPLKGQAAASMKSVAAWPLPGFMVVTLAGGQEPFVWLFHPDR